MVVYANIMRDQQFRSTVCSKSTFSEGILVRNRVHPFENTCIKLFEQVNKDDFRAVPEMLDLLNRQTFTLNQKGLSAGQKWIDVLDALKYDVMNVYWDGLVYEGREAEFRKKYEAIITISINVITSHLCAWGPDDAANLFTMIYHIRKDIESNDSMDWRQLLAVTILFRNACRSQANLNTIQDKVRKMSNSLLDKIQYEWTPTFIYPATLVHLDPILEKVLGSSWTNYRKNYTGPDLLTDEDKKFLSTAIKNDSLTKDVIDKVRNAHGGRDPDDYNNFLKPNPKTDRVTWGGKWETDKKKNLSLIAICIYRAAVMSVAFEECMESIFIDSQINNVIRQELLHSIVPILTSYMPVVGTTIAQIHNTLPPIDMFALQWFFWKNPAFRNTDNTTHDGIPMNSMSHWYLSKFKEEVQKKVNENLQKYISRENENLTAAKQTLNDKLLKRIEKQKARREKKKLQSPAHTTQSEPHRQSPSVGIEEECAICLDRIPNVQYFPCRHQVVCVECDKSMKEVDIGRLCPMCRHDIKDVIIAEQ